MIICENDKSSICALWTENNEPMVTALLCLLQHCGFSATFQTGFSLTNQFQLINKYYWFVIYEGISQKCQHFKI